MAARPDPVIINTIKMVQMHSVSSVNGTAGYTIFAVLIQSPSATARK